MTFDLISIGDSVIDTFIPLEEAEIVKGKSGQLLALPYGAKVPVQQSQSFVGGNAANNAMGAARLGLKTAIYTNVGNKDDDEADDRIKNKFKKEDVSTRFIVETNKLVSGHHIVLSYKGERTILSHHPAWEYNLPDLESCNWVYLTSMAPGYLQSSILEQLANFLERTHANLAYQPGTYQVKNGTKKMGGLLSGAQFLIMNLEEAKIFLDSDETSVKKLLQKLADLGPRNVVITDGRNGSYGFDGEKFWQIGLFPGEVVEATGAGDAYATGVLSALVHGKSLAEAMRWGAANGASVVEQVGSTVGLLTYNQMQEKLKENSKVMAQEL
jgi:sugar/nucleoside kinase (ribokinase family)